MDNFKAMIGVDPEHKTKQAAGIVTIGNDNVIREFSVIQRGIGDLDTQIQNKGESLAIAANHYIAILNKIGNRNNNCGSEEIIPLCTRKYLHFISVYYVKNF